MVCDAAMALNLVASLLMNGVCCMHSMEEQEKQKKEQAESLRRVIAVEWQRQRIIEQEEYERILEQKGLDAGSVMADERRRRYIIAKTIACEHAASTRGGSSAASRSDSHIRVCNESRNDDLHDQSSLPLQPISTTYDFKSGEDTRNVGHRSRSTPLSSNTRSARRIPIIVKTPSGISTTSSLFDVDSDDDSEEDEFHEILLTR